MLLLQAYLLLVSFSGPMLLADFANTMWFPHAEALHVGPFPSHLQRDLPTHIWDAGGA
jgi:hypothetical protein